MASLRLSCVLRRAHRTRQPDFHGELGALHHSSFLGTETDDLRWGWRDGDLSSVKDGSAKEKFPHSNGWRTSVLTFRSWQTYGLLLWLYSSVARGKRQNQESNSEALTIMNPWRAKRSFERTGRGWSKNSMKPILILCPKCGGGMRIIAFIEEQAVIENFLKGLRLW